MTRYDNKVDRFIFNALKRNGSLTCAELTKLLRSYSDRRVGYATTWMHLEELSKPSIGIVSKKKDGTRWSESESESESESDLFGNERCYSLTAEFQLE